MSPSRYPITRQQIAGLLIILTMIGAVVLCTHLIPQHEMPDAVVADTLLPTDSSHRHRPTYHKDTIRYPYHYHKAQRNNYPSRNKAATHPIRRRHFDPNTADSLTLLEQGLKPWQVSNMLRYRRAGGKWRSREDMHRLYGLDSAQYRAMAPYVRIAPDTARLARLRADSLRRDTMPRYVSLKRDTVVELNSADTTDLMKLRGIGTWTARKIVRYREQLGGYHSIEQLYEIEGISHEMLDTTTAHMRIEPELIRRISVNRCSIRQLSRHPYLRFEQAKAIYELRRNKIQLTSAEDLQQLPELSEKDLLRLTPYLSWE